MSKTFKLSKKEGLKCIRDILVGGIGYTIPLLLEVIPQIDLGAYSVLASAVCAMGAFFFNRYANLFRV